jgi:parvulin-like peptidyl-prolyl isomerase
MSKTISISSENIIHQVKLSCQMSAIVENIVNRKIIEKAAEDLKIVVETEELQQAANDFRLHNNLLGSKATISWLQKHHLSLDEFEEMLYLEILTSKLAKHLFGDRVEPFFVENQLDYVKAVLYEVILEDLDLGMELFYAIQEKEITFPQVAHQYIQDIELRRRGGYQGAIGRDRLKPEIASAVFASNPPQILKPILVGKKVYLIQVEEIIKPQLDDNLTSQILDKFFADWLKQKRQEIDRVSFENHFSSLP